ncbi:branched-chain amino acid ABC transporter permease [Sinorhizobium medicae]|uniref:branched-chain amino acid ABC transporter permease n=1 Tax=Sinorhizobium medicae TaxID=110321 RepID=UPI000FDC7E6E|nr:branched-chain amino acid ABC transporter permease [Sinorhizobium medicae]RVO73530.1 branched-chain amino acid ABC transporter permease [Sinorhizobium medicae]
MNSNSIPMEDGRVTSAKEGVLPSSASVWGQYALAMLACLAVMLALTGNSYWLNIICWTFLMAGLAGAWNIIAGFGGQFSLAHGVFMGIGAYTTLLLYTKLGISPWFGLIAGAALAALCSVPISWPTFRLRGPFFAIATVALNQIAFVLVNYSEGLTGGPRGILVPFRASFANMIFIERWKYALLMLAFMAIVTAVAVFVRRSRLGFQLLAVREDEDAARAAGIDVLATKLRGMALSAALTGAGGGLFAMYLRFVDPPTVFNLVEVAVKFALLTLVGGLGTVAGPIIGAAVLIPLENYLQGVLGGIIPGSHLVVFGTIMVIFALFMRRGIIGAIDSLLKMRGGRKQ